MSSISTFPRSLNQTIPSVGVPFIIHRRGWQEVNPCALFEVRQNFNLRFSPMCWLGLVLSRPERIVEVLQPEVRAPSPPPGRPPLRGAPEKVEADSLYSWQREQWRNLPEKSQAGREGSRTLGRKGPADILHIHVIVKGSFVEKLPIYKQDRRVE